MLVNLLIIGMLAAVVRKWGRPIALGVVYFLVIVSVGVFRGNELGAQVWTGALFSVFPVVALVLVSRFRTNRFVWVVLVLGATVANDLLQESVNRWAERRAQRAPLSQGP